MIIPHWSQVQWDRQRWPNFTPQEFACRHCGELYYDESVFDKAQHLREALHAPLKINSAHRCAIHNARVGGAPLSEHRKIALDLSIGRHERQRLRSLSRDVGFTGFGFYQTFLHVDTGRPRFWFGGDVSRRTWGNPSDSEVRQWIGLHS